ncbi:hypothetical protein SA21252_0027 [Staphylococcus aureus subsp. aureus 21252]|nr:hypothetical protein SA21252_0027 [Staphylococcus aureus subsp. aureus 21252]
MDARKIIPIQNYPPVYFIRRIKYTGGFLYTSKFSNDN